MSAMNLICHMFTDHKMDLPLDVERIVWSYLTLLELEYVWECSRFRVELNSRLPKNTVNINPEQLIAYMLFHHKLPWGVAAPKRDMYFNLPLRVQQLVLVYEGKRSISNSYLWVELCNRVPNAGLLFDVSAISFTVGEFGDRLLSTAIAYTFEHAEQSGYPSQPLCIPDHLAFIERFVPYIPRLDMNRYAFLALSNDNHRVFRFLWMYCTQFDLTQWSNILYLAIIHSRFDDITTEMLDRWEPEQYNPQYDFMTRAIKRNPQWVPQLLKLKLYNINRINDYIYCARKHNPCVCITPS